MPALVLLFGYSQHKAEGTTLALMVPPIGILAVLPWFKQGHVDVRAAALICVGFLAGGWIGGQLANSLSTIVLQRVFAISLLVFGGRIFLAK